MAHMTRQHFQLIAEALKSVKPEVTDTNWSSYKEGQAQQWEDTVTSVTNALRTTNGAFNEARFLEACGWPA